MHDNLDLLLRQIVQPHGLDQLQSLVHHGRRVGRDLRAHRPVWVLERLFPGDRAQFFCGLAEERAARSGQDDLIERIALARLHALEDSRVLGVYRQDVHALFACRLHDQSARADQRLLVGKRNVLAGINSGQRGQQSNHADHRGHDCIAVRMGRRCDQTVHAAHDRNIGIGKGDFEIACGGLVKRNAQLGMQCTRLLFEQLDIPIGGQCDHLGIDRGQNINGLCADRAGRTQNR